MMDQIYRRASETFVWLGTSTTESSEAIRSFSAYGLEALQYGIFDLSSRPDPTDSFEFGYERWTLGLPDPYGKHMMNKVIHNMHDPRRSSPLRMLASIMQRPWWSRIWVLQELLLSPNPIFVCGYQTITAKEFVASVRLYEAALTVYYEYLLPKPMDLSTHDNDLSLVREIGHETRNFHSMADVPALVLYTTQLRQRERSHYHRIQEPYFGLGNMWDLVQDITLSSRRLEAFDPRDRVYALLGIARMSRVDAVTIKPDYALSCADVYAQATYVFLQYTGAIMLTLATRSHKRASVPNLPSWAIDWSLTNLMTSPFPDAHELPQNLFRFTRSPYKKDILTTLATVYGRVETIKTKAPVPIPSVDPGEEHHSRIIAFLSEYLSGLDLHNRATLKVVKDSLQHLICSMILTSTEDISGAAKSEFALSDLYKASLYIQNRVICTHSLDSKSSEDPRDVIATEVVDGRPDCDSPKPLVASTIEMAGPSLDSDVLSYALDRISDAVRHESIAFVADGGMVGVGPQGICDGDLLIGYENESLRFAVRAVEDDLYELVGKVCVPQIDSQGATGANIHKVDTIDLC
ncbi:hypothetical protein OPT61_g1242 [Boeremia exigua]|uniref:Uncharacterized protein n=1 Tax=Boeremia exigua TaxID=749465 RepID=A0ACC2IQU1_9PLEO|nr:hypothetical protein OPT61_g1242 [Boeremia exigua]